MTKKDGTENVKPETQTPIPPIPTNGEAVAGEYQVAIGSITEGGKFYNLGQKVKLTTERAAIRLGNGTVRTIAATCLLAALLLIPAGMLWAGTDCKVQIRKEASGTSTRNPGRAVAWYSLGPQYWMPVLKGTTCGTAAIGTPALAVTNRYVTDTAMKATAYTLANSGLPGDGMARNITALVTTDTTADTAGHLIVKGKDWNGDNITDNMTLTADNQTVVGTKAFKSVWELKTGDWVVGGTADRIIVGFGAKVGLPQPIAATAQVDLATVGTTIVESSATGIGAIDNSTVDCSAGTYDGSKKLRVWIHN